MQDCMKLMNIKYLLTSLAKPLTTKNIDISYLNTPCC